jgi:TfoX/Sxy family transcriptional regulator of competence genes
MARLMATRPQTIEDLMDALRDLPGLSSRKMFGEYALYLQGKVVALICDDLLYIKPTQGALAVVTGPTMAPPYPGAKDHICLDSALDDPDLTIAALRAVEADLPEPKPKAPPKPKADKPRKKAPTPKAPTPKE